jgi:transcriptional regulatory protein LevR
VIDPALTQRLDLLRQSGQVDGDVAAFLAIWLVRTSASLGLEATERNFATLMTHTALAVQRARRGEAIEDWTADHTDELAGAPKATLAADQLVAEAYNELKLRLPRQERDFVALHLAAALLKAGRD